MPDFSSKKNPKKPFRDPPLMKPVFAKIKPEKSPKYFQNVSDQSLPDCMGDMKKLQEMPQEWLINTKWAPFGMEKRHSKIRFSKNAKIFSAENFLKKFQKFMPEIASKKIPKNPFRDPPLEKLFLKSF